MTDEGIHDELDVEDPLIAGPGHLCASLSLELTTDEQVREWLPNMVGIEPSLVFRLRDARQVAAFGEGTRLAVDHPDYQDVVGVAPVTVAELTADLAESD